MTAAFLILIGAAFLAIVAGGVIDRRKWEKTLESSSMVWDGVERRTDRTIDYRRPAKVKRPKDVYDHAEEVDA